MQHRKICHPDRSAAQYAASQNLSSRPQCRAVCSIAKSVIPTAVPRSMRHRKICHPDRSAAQYAARSGGITAPAQRLATLFDFRISIFEFRFSRLSLFPVTSVFRSL